MRSPSMSHPHSPQSAFPVPMLSKSQHQTLRPAHSLQNSITDVEGLSVGNARDRKLKSGVTVVRCDSKAVASCHILGGAPGTRETDLLAPECLVDGGRPSDAPNNQYNVGNSSGEMRDPRGNLRYGADRDGPGVPNQQYPGQTNSGSNMQSQAPTQAPVSGAGTVDIGKLTNLISAFQQKQQQNSQQSRSQQQQQQQHQQPQAQQQSQPQSQSLQGQPHGATQNQGPGRSMQGDRQGVAQFLQMPGVQQALQNIGGAGLGGYQTAYTQSMNQQNMGMGGPMGQNRGRGPDQGGHPHQGYYG